MVLNWNLGTTGEKALEILRSKFISFNSQNMKSIAIVGTPIITGFMHAAFLDPPAGSSRIKSVVLTTHTVWHSGKINRPHRCACRKPREVPGHLDKALGLVT